jgi:hypothetical protein
MLNQTAKVSQAWQIHLHHVAPNLHFMFVVDFAVETVRMTEALLQQPLHREVAAQHQIAKTFRIIQSHGEQVGIDILMSCMMLYISKHPCARLSLDFTTAQGHLDVCY